MKRSIFLWSRWGWMIACCCLMVLALTRCSQSTKPDNACQYDHECKGDNERCVYDDPSCGGNVGNLSCKGVCKSVGTNNNNNNCACKKDEDCNYPFEGCGNCQCYKRDVLTCASDQDCGRGRICVGNPGKQVCEVRTTCQKDEDCLNGYVCREQSCCASASGRCPGQCKTGSACQDDLDCLVCGLACKDGICSQQGPSCSGVKCSTNSECSQCGGVCQAGYCKVNNNPPACLGKACATNADCAACGGLCSQGQCQQNSNPTCTTGSCISDTDCQSRGLNSCLGGCCR